MDYYAATTSATGGVGHLALQTASGEQRIRFVMQLVSSGAEMATWYASTLRQKPTEQEQEGE